MAEFSEVIKQFKRMCRYTNHNRLPNECPLYCKGHGCNISHCRMLAFDDKKFANVVMAWAAEHPEPVYETWFEYLLRIGVIPENAPAGGEYQWIVESIKHKHISNDIAESLKLHPKEG